MRLRAVAGLALTLAFAAPAHAAQQTIVFAGGCFWGIQSVFEHTRGVVSAVSGYAGGWADKPSYEQVSSGRTGHAESVKVTFDPAQVSLDQLLKIFFTVAHDPTQLNRQGPDVGTQYRSAIFHRSPEQERLARAYITQLPNARRVVTQIVPFEAWYDAESYHQDFAAKNPRYPYIVYYDAPKVAHLKRDFGDLYRER